MRTRRPPDGLLVDAMATVRCEALADLDPLDEVLIAALAGPADAVQGEAAGLDNLRRRMTRLGRETLG